MISNGVVLDPRSLVEEIDSIEKNGHIVDLCIDPLTSIILPYHNLMDGISEASLRHNKIGTTGRGIGPAYEDKYGRRGIRFIDLFDPATFRKKLHENFELKKKIVEKVYGQAFDLDEETVFHDYSALASRLKKYLHDVSKIVSENIESKNIIFESAQGTFLDISYGTYPFVTASHPISGNVFVDVGFPPRKLDCVGIVKAYTTRVGSGVFLTELNDPLGEKIRQNGHEFGTTTGRPRRCGWLDLVMLQYAHRLNGFTSLAITKLDVLSGIDRIRVAVRYILDGKEAGYPLTLEQLDKCEIGYEEFPGFVIDENARSYDDLPEGAKKYLEFIEKYLGVPISIISIGPDRKQTIMK
jgi:adenylosuccinate synthase